MPDTVLSSTKIIKTSDGQTIFAEASGDQNKPHVVFIHGLSLSGAVFNEFCARADVLRELYVVRYDLRGHGRSCMPMTPEGHASSLYADDFKAVVEAFHLRKPILMGWSMGGIISSDIAAHLPHDILSGIFYLSASFHASLITGPAATQELGSVFIRHREPAAIPGAMIDFIDACLGSSAVSKPSYDLRCRYAGMGALQLPQMRALIVTRQQELEPIHKLLGSGIPVFHMYGTDDRLVQGSAMEEEHRKLVKSLEVVVVPGAGHTLFWERPDMVASRLIEFARSTASK